MLLKGYPKFLKPSAVALQQFLAQNKGSTSVIFGLSVIPLVMIASMAIDFGNGVRIKNELQSAADAGVLAAATALANGEDDTSKTQIAEDTFYANLSDNTLSGFSASPVTDVDFPNKQVTMTVSVKHARLATTMLTDHVGINVDATAIVDAGNPICMMALNPSAQAALYLNGTADLVADGCSVHVNSSHDEGLRQVGSGNATAESFCVHGGYAGSNYTPMPHKKCRQQNNPFGDYFDTDWAKVGTPTCDYQTDDIEDMFSNGANGVDTILLQPGVYCGGDLRIANGQTAILQSGSDGLYIFLDSGLDITSGGTVRNTVEPGDDVTPAPGETFPSETTIIFAGSNPGILEVNGGADLEIKAKSSGDFSGIAIAQVPTSIPDDPHLITGGGNVNIDGIVYFPTQELSIRGNGVIGQDADQFAIVADTIDIRGNGRLEIRIGADYQSAGLPELPEADGQVRLLD